MFKRKKLTHLLTCSVIMRGRDRTTQSWEWTLSDAEAEILISAEMQKNNLGVNQQ